MYQLSNISMSVNCNIRKELSVRFVSASKGYILASVDSATTSKREVANGTQSYVSSHLCSLQQCIAFNTSNRRQCRLWEKYPRRVKGITRRASKQCNQNCFERKPILDGLSMLTNPENNAEGTKDKRKKEEEDGAVLSFTNFRKLLNVLICPT